MKTSLLAAVAVALLATAPPVSAHFDYHYVGRCEFNAVSDGTDSPSTVWTGESTVVVVATDAGDPVAAPSPTTPISVECYLYIDGVFHLINTASGTGVAASYDANLTYQADPDSDVFLCEVVDVGGNWHAECHGPPNPPPLPEPVSDAIDVVFDQVDAVIDFVNEHILSNALFLCSITTAAPGTYGPVTIDGSGDTYLDGELWWDCPPYNA